MQRLCREQLQEKYDRREHMQAVRELGDTWTARYCGLLYHNDDGTIKGTIRDCDGNQYKVRFEWDGSKEWPAKLIFETEDLVEEFWWTTSRVFRVAIRWPLCRTEPVTLRKLKRGNDWKGRTIAFQVQTRKLFL